MRYSSLVLIATLVLPLPLEAKTYRCEDADGNVGFQDQPCDNTEGSTVDVGADSAQSAEPQGKSIGSFTAGDKRLTLRDHAVHWDKDSGELTIVLTPTKLSDGDRQDIRDGDPHYFAIDQDESPGLPRWDGYPYVMIELRFKPSEVARENLDNVRIIDVGIQKDTLTRTMGPLAEDAKDQFDVLNRRSGQFSMSYTSEWTDRDSGDAEYQWSISF